jgi:hypothetical protein
MRPYTCPDELGEGEVATWAPSSSTLISGPTEAILIDALLTFENADQIAAWAKSFGKKITGVYITHGHSDHWLGLARLLQHFPRHADTRLRRYRSRRLRGGVQQDEQVLDVALPRGTPRDAGRARGVNTDEILVDGQVVNLIHVGQGDVESSTEIVVAGHKSVGAADLPQNLAVSQRYLRDFTTLAKKGAPQRTWSTACSNCMASATSRTPYDLGPRRSRPTDMKPQRSGNFAVRTDQPTARPHGLGAWRNCPI